MVRVVAALVRASLMTAMQYRSNFLFGLVTGLLGNLARIAPLLLVYAHTDAVDGWKLPEAMLVMSGFLLLVAVQGGLLEPNLGEAVEGIREGNLDLVLLKPADAQLLVSVRKVDVDSVWDLVAAVLIGAWALARTGLPTPFDALVAVVVLACGLVAIYGLWLLAICASFWFVRVDNLRFLLWSAADAGRWPVGVFGPVIRTILVVVVPIAVVTTLPVDAIRGTWTAWTVATAVAVATLFALGSRWAWTRSLAAYTSASS